MSCGHTSITENGQTHLVLVLPLVGSPFNPPPPPITTARQDPSGLTGALSDVAIRLLNAESLSPVIVAVCKADNEM